MMKRICYIAVLALAAAACSKSGLNDTAGDGTDVQSGPIRFRVTDVSITKSGISEINDIIGNIRIRATRGSDVVGRTYDNKGVVTAAGYENIGLLLDSNTGLWSPAYSPEETWQYSDVENREVLDSTKNPPVSFVPPQYKDVTVVRNNYSFSAYAFNSAVPSGAAAPDVTLVTSGAEFGTRLNGLSQPVVYVHPSDGKPFGYDYLFSNRYDVSTSMSGGKVSGDVVKLHMEHALASVNVKLVVSKYIHEVKFRGVRLEGFYTTADMTCTSQGLYDASASGNKNVWVSENLKNLNTDSGYSRGSVTNPNADPLFFVNPDPSDAEDNSTVLLNFCAIPQLLTKNCLLTVDFDVQQIADGPVTRFHQTWELMRYYDWESGQRNNYTIRVASASELIAGIDAWAFAYEVSETILP